MIITPSHCPSRNACRPATRAHARRQRRQASGALALMMIVVLQMIAACHEEAPPARPAIGDTILVVPTTDPIAALIAVSLCRSSGAARPGDEPANGPSAGCLHCASGGCHGGARGNAAGTWAGFAVLNLHAERRSDLGNDRAAPWQTGHPVRGPPLWGL